MKISTPYCAFTTSKRQLRCNSTSFERWRNCCLATTTTRLASGTHAIHIQLLLCAVWMDKVCRPIAVELTKMASIGRKPINLASNDRLRSILHRRVILDVKVVDSSLRVKVSVQELPNMEIGVIAVNTVKFGKHYLNKLRVI